MDKLRESLIYLYFLWSFFTFKCSQFTNDFGNKNIFPNPSLCQNRVTSSGLWYNRDKDIAQLRFQQYNCWCDLKCKTYLDCCIDAQILYSNVLVGIIKTFACFTPLGQSFSVYMVNSCPPDFSKLKIKSLCEKEIKSLLLQTPVTSYTSRIVYKNILCSMCHNDHSAKYWKATFRCSNTKQETRIIPIKNIVHALDHLHFNHKTHNWEFSIIKASGKETCLLSVRSPWKGARFCTPHISDCHPLWSNYQFRQKCLSFTSYVYGRVKKGSYSWHAYKNYYCAVCNYVDEKNIYPRSETISSVIHSLKVIRKRDVSFSSILGTGDEQNEKSDFEVETNTNNNKVTPGGNGVSSASIPKSKSPDSNATPINNPCPPKQQFNKITKQCQLTETEINCGKFKRVEKEKCKNIDR